MRGGGKKARGGPGIVGAALSPRSFRTAVPVDCNA